MRYAALTYGGLAYLLFLGTFLYAIGFVSGLVVPKTIDTGPPSPLPLAIAINAALAGLFAVQHTIMARPGFKRWWTRFVPRPVERSTFVVFASLILVLLMWQWRPIGASVWHVEAPIARALLTAVGLFGWGLALYSTFVIDHFDLFGLRQVWLSFRGGEYTHRPFAERSVYRHVRHPLMLGFIIAFWATPDMTAGHLLFAGLVTGYALVGIRFEEGDLVRILGRPYEAYRQRTPMLIPVPRALLHRKVERPQAAATPMMETDVETTP